MRRLMANQDFPLTESLFLRALGLVYAIAFGSLWPQIRALVGTDGILPVNTTLLSFRNDAGWMAYLYAPSIVWLHPGDFLLILCCALGCAAASLLALGIWTRWAAIATYVLYLSLVSVGEPFTSFQWDALLLESGFLAIFQGAALLPLAYRLLLFRLMFESGVVKLASGDPNWRNLHALRFHFFTQPLPMPLAYYLQKAPNWLLDGMTAATLAIELIVPFLLFGPRAVRRAAVILLIALQVLILLTGNYAFFNLLTIALCLWGLDDSFWNRWRSWGRPCRSYAGLNWPVGVLVGLGLLRVTVQTVPATATVLDIQPPFLASFEVVNNYGLFAVMTTSRREIELEVSNDGEHWAAFTFPYKPGPVDRGLPVIAPYQPRLDWQLWFAALGDYRDSPWMENLMFRLLQNGRRVKGLFASAPEEPPRFVRAVTYDYEFSSMPERSQKGAIWSRKFHSIWLGPLGLER